ncbi:MAG: histone deacetylase [Candidatus Lokiarchaeota archaeon]|nr:histone deacetylase [Candidatus Lokiarchaeota archaeon]
MTTGIIYSPIYLEHRIGQHIESHNRLIAIMDLLKEKGILENPNFKIIEPRQATLDQIKYVHTENLINQVKKISEIAAETGHIQNLDMDTSVSAKTYEASLYSVGGNLEAADRIVNGEIKNAFAIVRPPGHHSKVDKCSGFCIFNNIAITAEYLLREKGFKRIAIIDWDCHHGDGTQQIFFEGSPSNQGDILFFSSHQDGRTLYPGSGFINEIGFGKGEGKIINYPIPPKAAEDVLMIFFNEIINPICDEFKPEFILISAGFDTHWTDRLTNMGWTYQAPANFLKKIMKIANKYANDKILITLEGGYEIDKQAIAVYNCLRVLNNEKNNIIEEKFRKSDEDLLNYVNSKLVPSLKKKLSSYWNCF